MKNAYNASAYGSFAYVYDIFMDGDFDEAGWEKLRSFLYYCEV